MRLRFAAPALASLAAVMAGQGGRNSGGWSERQSFEAADVIVVGDLVEGAASDDGSQVSVKGVLQVRRPVKGEAFPGARLRIAWVYRPAPNEGPAVTMRVPRAQGLWMLKRSGEGVHEALRVARVPEPLGGACLPLPKGELSPDFYYLPDATPDTKLAQELGAALETIAAKVGDGLNPKRRLLPSGAMWSRASPEGLLFESTRALLFVAGQDASLSVFRRFAGSLLPNLRAVGLAGLLRHGDTSAVFALEREAEALAPTLDAPEIAKNLDSLRLDEDRAAMHSLARTALSGAELPGFEGRVAFRLGWAGTLEAFPYLAAMLESPNSHTRVSAAMAFCNALRPSPARPAADFQKLWKPEMKQYCPDGFPMQDGEAEQTVIAFWKAWWAEQRQKAPEAAALPPVDPPARYRRVQPPPGYEEAVEVSMEQRFNMLMRMVKPADAKAGRPRTMIGTRLDASDDEGLFEVMDQTSRRLEELGQAVRKILDAARIQGRPPDLGQMRKAEETRIQILRDGLEETRRRLSPDGWRVVEKFMREMHISSMRLTAPAAGKK